MSVLDLVLSDFNFYRWLTRAKWHKFYYRLGNRTSDVWMRDEELNRYGLEPVSQGEEK